MNIWLLVIVVLGAVLFFGMPTLLHWRIAILHALGLDRLAAHFERQFSRWLAVGRVIVIAIVTSAVLWTSFGSPPWSRESQAGTGANLSQPTAACPSVRTTLFQLYSPDHLV